MKSWAQREFWYRVEIPLSATLVILAIHTCYYKSLLKRYRRRWLWLFAIFNLSTLRAVRGFRRVVVSTKESNPSKRRLV